ncbi:cutinase family protein [Dietzia cinnamea]|uniref:cutinase family protein n=1 Tax=Dietzia cinnamea TaxID=321318 RepID=UPI00223C0E49|nr:cutinase family protein [Dietzia cinnamea]MCT1639878.1 cutinase family protein [Dietzia cinnamea]MCT2077166.1 cutinase family protein [Dietzia cinnamea]MCT2145795.1 cutinase family protein [Dietzia cinnamea]MCT2221271.1 cutinase family protein [Dietzia cinnamea]MCT2275266.1 cutinase family protein [Dietzia cinnamea]
MALPEGDECPLVQLVAINGTTESTRNSKTDADTGWMARVVSPTVRAANADGQARMSRTYVPYPASFGGFVPSEDQSSYAESVTVGIENGRKLIAETIERCPETKIFVSGYSQGAQVASALAREIGAGSGPVTPEQFAGAALMSDPTRAQGAPIFQEGSSRTTPGTVPGTEGAAVAAINVGEGAPRPEGRGISPNTSAPDFGAVADRVASFCVPGDLACDTPPDSDLFQVVANIAGQSETGGDPIRALVNVATVAGQSVLFTAAETIAEDVEYSDGSGFTIAPASRGNTTLSRMARYSDPTQVQNPTDPTALLVEAGTKLAGMALGASITVAKKTLTPENIAQIAVAGAASPAAAATVLVGQLAVAASEVITPATVDSGLQRVIGEIEHTVSDTTGLVDLATQTQTWNAIDAHGMYDRTPFTASGQSPAAITQQWALAAANDLAVARGMEPVSEISHSTNADRMALIRSGAGNDQLSKLPATSQTADIAGLSEALASVTA